MCEIAQRLRWKRFDFNGLREGQCARCPRSTQRTRLCSPCCRDGRKGEGQIEPAQAAYLNFEAWH
ncbi:hypothetical protein CPT_Musica_048 [Burkholderia phage Musica]|uniref:Uncharacterized protein n=1 Tax=Burkholderia phage Musica TaxID=2924903 RepID=A0AAE9G318_9CAUD|nr:hypothetical protein CPT_Musica_048 [Burkholderia phage Musica]